MTKFSDLNLNTKVLKAIEEAGYDTPTPIQAGAIPAALEGRDVLGIAQTGTGKTAAFGIPLIAQMLQMEGRPMPKSVRGLVLAPTRELATQISVNLRSFAEGTAIQVAMVVGGQNINTQIKRLHNGVDILVATPGRLMDLHSQNAVKFDHLEVLVLDEAARIPFR